MNTGPWLEVDGLGSAGRSFLAPSGFRWAGLACGSCWLVSVPRCGSDGGGSGGQGLGWARVLLEYEHVMEEGEKGFWFSSVHIGLSLVF